MNPLIIIYTLIFILGLCIVGFITIMIFLIGKLMKKNKEPSFEFFEFLIPGVFGGIIAVILLELRGKGMANIVFWSINLPLTILLVAIFVFFGLGYFLFIKYLKEKKLNAPKKLTSTINKIKEILTKKNPLDNEVKSKNKRPVNWTKRQTIATIILAIIAVVSLFVSWNVAKEANEIAKKALELLPSKYAELRITTPNYKYLPIFRLEDVKGEDSFPFLLENIGSQDSGYVKIEFEDDMLNSDLIEFTNINKSQKIRNNILKFSSNPMENPDFYLLNKKTIRLRIKCDGCEKQIGYKIIDICIYNQSANECFL